MGKGILVGNGLTNVEEQFKWYPQMAKDGGKGEGGTLKEGVITNIIGQGAMKLGLKVCLPDIEACNNYNLSSQESSCSSAFIKCNVAETTPYRLTGYNPYDMRIKCAVPPLCYDFSNVETFLN